MVTAMSSARDRWQFEQAGDGSVTIVNRATGNLLTQAPSGCTYAAPVSSSANQAWLVGGTS
jgi:ricin-type beta-trefoil lectin protein